MSRKRWASFFVWPHLLIGLVAHFLFISLVHKLRGHFRRHWDPVGAKFPILEDTMCESKSRLHFC